MDRIPTQRIPVEPIDPDSDAGKAAAAALTAVVLEVKAEIARDLAAKQRAADPERAA